MKKVSFHYADKDLKISEKNKIRDFIEYIFIHENKILKKLDYVFCSDNYLLRINNHFLNHNYYTDVITFNLSDSTEEIIGEIYISIDRVSENAINFGVSVKKELLRVIFHGSLHLCGYKDKTKSEIIKIRKKEDKYIRDFENI